MIMLLRHSNTTVAQLLDSGSTIEEYTEVQPIGSRYDYLDDARALYRWLLSSSMIAFMRFIALGCCARGAHIRLRVAHIETSIGHEEKMERPARRYKLEAIQNPFLGAAVTG